MQASRPLCGGPALSLSPIWLPSIAVLWRPSRRSWTSGPERIRHLRHSLSTNRFDKDIPFRNAFEEAGFILLAHALDFGSWFGPCAAPTQKGQRRVADHSRRAAAPRPENPACHAAWLAGLTLQEVSDLFDLQAAELQPLAMYLHQDIVEIGSSRSHKREFLSHGGPPGRERGCGRAG